MSFPDDGYVTRIVALLEELRLAEREQAVFYRALSAMAEETNVPEAQRFHDLHADEQHHLSRLTARVLELGGRPVDLSAVRVDATLEDWEGVVAARERAELNRYRKALDAVGDDQTTKALLTGILEVEEFHARDLGGKWTMA